MGMKAAFRYTSKDFRRGAPQELLQHGSTISLIKSSGDWIGSGYGSYIDLEFDKAQKISKILTAKLSAISPSGGDSG